jgi:hypothetical protein
LPADRPFLPALGQRSDGVGPTAMTRHWTQAFAVLACLGLGPTAVGAQTPAAGEALALTASRAIDSRIEERLLALDPEQISEEDVRDVLAHAPAPRIIALHGSVPITTMTPFSEFLIAMGYPEERLRNPGDGRLTYSSFADSRAVAGALAWHYEREGMVPMLIGHSQGGMLAVKVLQDLAGASGTQLPVWNPIRGEAEGRMAVVDPFSRTERTVVGLQVPYAAALATGSVMRIVLGQWDMVARLRIVPDTVEEFTGYFIEWDPLAGTGPNAARDDPYRATGRARVRNVMLPSDYGHIGLPRVRHLAENAATRHWISVYKPNSQAPAPPAIEDADVTNIVHAADIWFSVKKHWCLEAQRFARATHRAGS